MGQQASPLFSLSWDRNLSVAQPAPTWGEPGAFTTILVIYEKGRKTAFFVHEHWHRLFDSLERVEVDTPFSREGVRDCFRQAMEMVTEEGRYLLRVMVTAERVGITAFSREEPQLYVEGHLFDYQRRTPEAKSLDYADLVEALDKIDRDREELLLLSDDGRLLEGATSNLLFVSDKVIHVPNRDCLQGITLKVLLGKLGEFYEIVEGDVALEQISEFTEILCVGTGKMVASVQLIEELEWFMKAQKAIRKIRIMLEHTMIEYRNSLS